MAITLYELLHHTTATKYKVFYHGDPLCEMNVDNFMNYMNEYGGALVWIFSATGKDEIEIIIKDA